MRHERNSNELNEIIKASLATKTTIFGGEECAINADHVEKGWQMRSKKTQPTQSTLPVESVYNRIVQVNSETLQAIEKCLFERSPEAYYDISPLVAKNMDSITRSGRVIMEHNAFHMAIKTTKEDYWQAAPSTRLDKVFYAARKAFYVGDQTFDIELPRGQYHMQVIRMHIRQLEREDILIFSDESAPAKLVSILKKDAEKSIRQTLIRRSMQNNL